MARKSTKARQAPQPVQLDLFPAMPIAAEPNRASAGVAESDMISVSVQDKSAPSWIARNWPQYLAGQRVRPRAASATVYWARSFPGLQKGALALLSTLGSEAGDTRSCRMCLPALARDNAMARNTCRRHLETLLTAGLVMMKVWTEPTRRSSSTLGYEFRLIVDVDDRAAAIVDGFADRRMTSARPQAAAKRS